MADDWDLNAIVRSCSSAAASCSTSNTPPNHNPLAGLSFDDHEPDTSFAFPDLSAQPENRYSYRFHELQDSYKPFLSAATGQRSVFIPPSQPPPANPPAVKHKTRHHQLQSPQDIAGGRRKDQRVQSTVITLGPPSFHPSLRSPAAMQPQPARPRKKKNNQKRLVVEVTADGLSNDVWAWRKYGQKPIKGSPYPRNYYRCSSSKGCPARKQVERSTTDPNMFTISYAGDHTHPKPTHRNSLAGSTRTKFAAVAKTGAEEVKESELAAATASLSPTTPLSATTDPDNNVGDGAAVVTAMERAGGDEMDGLADFESGDDDANVDDFDRICDDDDDDGNDSVLIPNSNNVAVGAGIEDLFILGWQELGGGG